MLNQVALVADKTLGEVAKRMVPVMINRVFILDYNIPVYFSHKTLIMAPYTFTQINWKSSLILIVPVLLLQGMQEHFGFGLSMLLAIAVGVLLGFITNKFFKTAVEFRESYLLVQKWYFGKTKKYRIQN